MSIQAFGADFPKSLALIDPQTGLLEKTWRYVLLQLWNRTGQGTGIIPSVSKPLTATGGTLSTVMSLTDDWNFFSTVALGTGCSILPLKPGNDIQVFNGGAHALNVFPPNAADQIDALAAGAPYVLAPGSLRVFECWAINPGQFYSFGN